MTSALSFKTRMDPPHLCVLSSAWCIPQICLWVRHLPTNGTFTLHGNGIEIMRGTRSEINGFWYTMQECSHWSKIGTGIRTYSYCASPGCAQCYIRITPNFEASVTSVETPNGFDSQINETRMHSSRMCTAHSLLYGGLYSGVSA